MTPVEQRAQTVAKEIDEILRDVMPKLIKLGHLRTELSLLVEELESDVKKEP